MLAGRVFAGAAFSVCLLSVGFLRSPPARRPRSLLLVVVDTLRFDAGDGLCSLSADGAALLERRLRSGSLSARGLHRVRRVAQTIADLEGAPAISAAHVAESLSYRARSRHDR